MNRPAPAGLTLHGSPGRCPRLVMNKRLWRVKSVTNVPSFWVEQMGRLVEWWNATSGRVGKIGARRLPDAKLTIVLAAFARYGVPGERPIHLIATPRLLTGRFEVEDCAKQPGNKKVHLPICEMAARSQQSGPARCLHRRLHLLQSGPGFSLTRLL